MGFLSTLGRVGAGVATLGLSEVANEVTGGGIYGGGSNVLGLGDIIRGKKDAGVPDKFLDLDPSLGRVTEEGRKGQSQGLELYASELERLKGLDPAALSQIVQAKGQKALIGQGKDQQRRAAQLVAQRGLNRSSVGLNAMINAGDQTGDKIAAMKANAPLVQEQIAGQRLQSIGRATGGINQVLGSQGAQRDFVQGRNGGKRSGGLLGLIGGAAGAYAAGSNGGNPMQGFQAGQGIGQGLANF